MNHLHYWLASNRHEFSYGDDDGRVHQDLPRMFRRHLPKLRHDQYRRELQIVYIQETDKFDRAQLSNQLNLGEVGNYLAHNQEVCRYLGQ
jgi:hypothetical protein